MSTESSINLLPHGDRTVAKICGEKWPRIMSVRMASAYAGLISGSQFKKIPALAGLIKCPFGDTKGEYVDRIELDNAINLIMTESAKR